MYDGYEYQFGKIERDTVYPNSETYFHLPSPFDFEDCRVDSFGNILSISRPFFVGPPTPEEYLLFKADAILDEVWPVAWDFNIVIDTGYAKCIYVDSVYLFGKTRLVKGVLIFDFSYYYYYFWLAEGIGLVREQYDDGTTSLLNYAKIDGEIYGTLVSIEDEYSVTPKEFNVSQNYPNPFNPSTIINYAVKEAGLVKIKVFDILGSEVAELINESKDAGNHSVEFNAANLPSGVYFYTLQINEYSASKKMLFMK
jgi:hypothetical protein